MKSWLRIVLVVLVLAPWTTTIATSFAADNPVKATSDNAAVTNDSNTNATEIKDEPTIVERGGMLMIPIGLCSLIVLTIFLERLWRLSTRHVAPAGFVRTILKLVRDRDLEQAETACLQSSTSFAQIAFVTIKNKHLPRTERKVLADERGSQEVTRLERRVGVVGVMATIAPLLGLLGTVTGMIQVFQKIEHVPDPDIGLLAGGIWEALITTGAGLTVAIPAYVMYRFLLSRVDQAALTLEEGTQDLLEAIDDETAVSA